MSNHVHLLVTPPHALALSGMMQAVGRAYVRYFNDHHARTGTLLEGRFRSILVQSTRYFFACSRYIELNPVRAGIVRSPNDYAWSSYRANTRREKGSLVTAHLLYRELGADDRSRRMAYRSMFGTPIDADTLQLLRASARSQAAIGAKAFVQRVARRMRRPTVPLRHGGDRRSAAFQSTRIAISTNLTPRNDDVSTNLTP